MMKNWVFDSENLPAFLRKLKRENRLDRSESTWAMSVGGYNLPPLFEKLNPEMVISTKRFGRINIIRLNNQVSSRQAAVFD